jgi:sigma-B regulation protein RsbU (phosphoserine phosphatase)
MKEISGANPNCLRILVVEDDPTDLKLTRTVLREAGNEVIEARDAENALSLLEGKKPDVILVDMELPGMNGMELARRLKQDSGTAGIPVIAMTAYPGHYSKGAASEGGFAAYFVKPINTRTLAQQVASVALGKRGASAKTAVLVADDNEINRKLLRAVLEGDGYSVNVVHDGLAALAALRAATDPVVALIDWEMPGMEGIDVCRQARLRTDGPPMFLILLTVRDGQPDVVAGLQAGANDYVTKPFERAELLARVKIGAEMVELQQSLANRVEELQNALAEVKQLSGCLPICGYCKKIRDDKDYWQQVEVYVARHSDAKFSHGVCPECYAKLVKPQMDRLGIKPRSVRAPGDPGPK